MTVAHDNASSGAPDLVTANRVETGDRGLLHFNGVVNAGAVVAVFTNIVNTPTNEVANPPGISTHVAFGVNGG